MRSKSPHWIRHSHLFDPDEFECTACGTRFADTNPTCPVCGKHMNGAVDPQDWIDEAEMLDIILGDD